MLCAIFVCHIAELQKHKRSVQNTDWIGTISWQLTHPCHPRFYSLFGLFWKPLLVVDWEHAPVVWHTASAALPPGPGRVRLVAALPGPRLVLRVPVRVLLAAPQQVLLFTGRGWAASAEWESILDSFERYVPSRAKLLMLFRYPLSSMIPFPSVCLRLGTCVIFTSLMPGAPTIVTHCV